MSSAFDDISNQLSQQKKKNRQSHPNLILKGFSGVIYQERKQCVLFHFLYKIMLKNAQFTSFKST